MVATISSPQAGRAVVAGSEVIMLGSNNYLGMASHPVVIEAVKAAVDRYGLGTCINPCFVQTPVHEQLASAVAKLLGAEDAILFGSCSAANAGVLATLVDHGEAIFSDRNNHASIIDGCKLSRAKTVVYPHCDVRGLAEALAANSDCKPGLVITDGVFSMEGHVAPLTQLLEIAADYGATLVVDDSHGCGIVGPGGRGSVAASELATSQVVISGTFSKALGGAPGGFVAASRETVAKLRHAARSFIFTTGMSVADAAGALAALLNLEHDSKPFERLWSNTRAFRTQLREGGVAVDDRASPITPLHIGDSDRAKAIQSRLLEHGVYIPAMVYPVVPQGEARLRAQPSAAHSVADMTSAAAAIRQALSEIPA